MMKTGSSSSGLLIIGLLMLLTSEAHANVRCLRGELTTSFCKTVVINYWSHEQRIRVAAQQAGLEPALLKALVAVESQFNHKARSPKDAIGLTQVLPSTAREVGIDNGYQALLDPDVSLQAGAEYLKKMWFTFRDWNLALAAYNAGPGAVKRFGGIPPYPETQAYVRNVLSLYREFKMAEQAVIHQPLSR